MDNITLISCSYNTPDVTVNMLKTFLNLHPKCSVLICENSNNNLTQNILRAAYIPFIINENGLHGPSVDILLKSVDTKYALLVDTDVLFLRNHNDIFNSFKDMDLTLMGDICGSRGGKQLYNRVHPWHCFINVENVNKNNIRFYDEKRLLEKSTIEHDVGSTFFQDIKDKALRIGDFKGEGLYYKHYEGMSWRVQRYGKVAGDINTSTTATHNMQGLYEYGLTVQAKYKHDTQHLNAVDLFYKM